jgi:hypothetical protein
MRIAIQLFSSESKKYDYTATIECNTQYQGLLKFVRMIKKENTPIHSIGYIVLLNK